MRSPPAIGRMPRAPEKTPETLTQSLRMCAEHRTPGVHTGIKSCPFGHLTQRMVNAVNRGVVFECLGLYQVVKVALRSFRAIGDPRPDRFVNPVNIVIKRLRMM